MSNVGKLVYKNGVLIGEVVIQFYAINGVNYIILLKGYGLSIYKNDWKKVLPGDQLLGKEADHKYFINPDNKFQILCGKYLRDITFDYNRTFESGEILKNE